MAAPLDEWARQVYSAPAGALVAVLVQEKRLTLQLLNDLIAVETNYLPRGGQKRLHEAEWARTKIAAGGWRSGKSRWTAREVTYRILPPRSLGWIIGKDYELGRPEFLYVKQDLEALGWPGIVDLSNPQHGSWVMKLSNGSVVQTKTAEDVAKIEAEACDVVALIEAGSLTEATYNAARGRVLERRGTIVLSGRFRGAYSWYVKKWRQGQHTGNLLKAVSASMPSWENEVVYPPCDPATCRLTTGWPADSLVPLHGGFHNEEIQMNLNTSTADDFGEKFAAEPRPDRVLVFGGWWNPETHMVPFRWEKGLTAPEPVPDGGGKLMGWRLPRAAPLEVWIDPGYAGGYYVGIYQMHGPFVFQIDEIFQQGAVAEEVIALVKNRPYWPYVKAGVGDLAVRQHQGMPSHREVWMKETGVYLRSEVVLIEDGIERVRTFLKDPRTKRPRIYFNTPCRRMAWEMEEGYRYPQGNTEDEPDQREKPIDKNNHGCKALAYGLIANYGRTELSAMTEPRSYTY